MGARVETDAARTEDHPLDYLDFEGTIPTHEYGGGAVIVWDAGHWENTTGDEGKTVPVDEALDQGLTHDGGNSAPASASQYTDAGSAIASRPSSLGLQPARPSRVSSSTSATVVFGRRPSTPHQVAT